MVTGMSMVVRTIIRLSDYRRRHRNVVIEDRRIARVMLSLLLGNRARRCILPFGVVSDSVSLSITRVNVGRILAV